VFRNADIAEVVAKADALSLSAVQLHGDEDQAYIDALRHAGTAGADLESASVGDTLPRVT
jgi:indole-3-glycerol phosphate synthase/phosphoribosylanthranilate isomerase